VKFIGFYKIHVHRTTVCLAFHVCLQVYEATVFNSLSSEVEVEEERIELSLWDTSGEKALQKTATDCEGVNVVISSGF
jgi:GTPase SAR1 family protein